MYETESLYRSFTPFIKTQKQVETKEVKNEVGDTGEENDIRPQSHRSVDYLDIIYKIRNKLGETYVSYIR